MQYRLTTPVSKDDLAPLRAGDTVLLSGALRGGAHIVQGGALHREGQGLPPVKQLHHALMGGVPGGVDRPGQQNGVSRPEGG